MNRFVIKTVDLFGMAALGLCAGLGVGVGLMILYGSLPLDAHEAIWDATPPSVRCQLLLPGYEE